MNTSCDPKTPERRTQARGRIRRELMVQAAKNLLETRSISTIKMVDVARVVQIPIGSAYHLFPDLDAIWLAVVCDFEAELHAWQSETSIGDAQSWQDIVARYIRHGAAFFGKSPAATQLMLGPFSPPSIKLKDRDNDYAIALLLLSRVSTKFRLANLDDLPHAFFHAIEIADVFFSLSIIRHDRIMPYYVVEATRAAVAYLEVYLPSVLSLETRTVDIISSK